ncbi:hypothetical protein SAMN05443575_3900 [Jatrophihabitans endophyticus]|uniref:Uncharacterized protein n=1 Tax=Jatrophihabitans endophyticus TaxID=1206085 RepID=A0A1M5T4R1_9ACTN|nr:hypothetical protein SAMN05443575_3900 [Jatrophihabitans endophyticus]
MVAAATVGVVSLPLVARLLPGEGTPVGVRTLLARIAGSAGVGYSGFAESHSTLAVPTAGAGVTGIFAPLATVLAETSQLRVWWRDADDWRVDRIKATGESGLRETGGALWQWEYETGSLRRSTLRPTVRAPRPDDLVPPGLARRLLGEARADEVSAIPGRRVAGERTDGLRLRVTDRRSTLDHVDVWALPASGLPVRVDVHARGAAGSGGPVLSTSFLDLTVARPPAGTIAFTPPDGVATQEDDVDIVSVIDRFSGAVPPARLAGLPRRTDLDLGAVGVYGRGLTLVVAIPMRPRVADRVVPVVRAAPGAVEDESGIAAGIGPLRLQLSPPTGHGSRWLLAGTLSPSALRAAARDLPPARAATRPAR